MEWDHFKQLLQSTLLGNTTDYFFNYNISPAVRFVVNSELILLGKCLSCHNFN